MMKHVRSAQQRSSICEHNQHATHSRASSGFSSDSKAIIKVYTSNMRSDVEYKTISVTFETTSKEIIELLMKKLKIKNRDPRLYLISMDIAIRRTGVCTSIHLEEWECPAMLQSSYPRGEHARFTVRTKEGYLVKIYDSELNKNSQYKTLMISDETTTSELIELYLNICGYNDNSDDYSLHEIDSKSNQTNRILQTDKPLKSQQEFYTFTFKIQKNPKYVKNMFAKSWIPKLPVLPPMIDENHYVRFDSYSLLNRKYNLSIFTPPDSNFVVNTSRFSDYCI